MTTLRRTSSCLRRLLNGKAHAFARHQVRSTAERAAGRPGATVDQVVEAIRKAHGSRLMGPELDQLRHALERDMPEGAA
jgi:hypothetical protein